MRAFLLFTVVTSVSTAADKPNFVWLISEDNSKHFLKLFDTHGAETPHIAKLAKHGLIFDHAFSNAPVCSVARTTLITGCYGPRIGTQYHRRAEMAPLPPGLRLFPSYLRDEGYYTTNKSKTDYNVKGIRGTWDESSNKASWRNRKEGQPFFHKQSFGTSHEGSLHFPTQDIEHKATTTDPETVFINPRHPKTATFKYTYARYHDNIMKVDREIGHVVDQLAADGLLEDTFIFYFGDHGGVLPGSKGYAYETGLHVPLVVRVPQKWKQLADFRIGSRVSGFVSFVDFGPTLLQLAGLKVPDAMDGKPFMGKGVTSAEVNQRDEAFGYADRFDEKIDFVRTVRKGKYKYIRNFTPFNYDALQNNYRYIQAAYAEWRQLYDAGKLNAVQRSFFEPRPIEELYDVEADPYETKNLATDGAHVAVLRSLRSNLGSRMRSMPDLSVYPESVMLARGITNPVQFGQMQKDEISRLLDIADLAVADTLSVDAFTEALSSGNAMVRYWAVTTASAARLRSSNFPIAGLDQSDPNLLVRTRAAEYLGLLTQYDPAPPLLNILRESRNAVEANEILNTIVMLRDGEHRHAIHVKREDVHESIRNSENVKRRLDYLTSKLGRGDRWVRKPRAKRERNRSKSK